MRRTWSVKNDRFFEKNGIDEEFAHILNDNIIFGKKVSQ